jgi:hypothetical protein
MPGEACALGQEKIQKKKGLLIMTFEVEIG